MIPNLIIIANFLIILVFSIADPSISDIFKVIGVIAIIISTYFAVNYKLKSVQKDVRDVKEDVCQLRNELEKKVDSILFNEIKNTMKEMKDDLKFLLRNSINRFKKEE